MIEDDIYEYDFSDMNWQYALFTVFNIVSVKCIVG